ncbi:MAG TPA: general secretion pathway protein GspB [Gammaproteobacteria bacterium]|nr:general secretion pathway protein GspB [Gammaproteobacteria bacterium]
MSLILDALRKSERTRQQSLTGRLGAVETPPVRTRLPVPWVTLLGLLLLVNAIVLGVLFFGPRPATNPPTAAENPAPAAPADYHPSVRSLAEEAGTPVNPAPAAGVQSVSPPPAASTAAPAPMMVENAAALPSFDNLPPELRQNLPTLHLDVHGYAANPQDRFVVINLKRYRIGDTLTEGPRVVDIVPQGAVLEFNGTRFLLPAL